MSPIGDVLTKNGQKEHTETMAKPIATPADPIRDRSKISLIKEMLKGRGKKEQYLLFVIGVNSGLRAGDILQLTYDDLYNKDGSIKKQFAKHTQKNTSKKRKHGSRVIVQINKSIQEALRFAHEGLDVTDILTRRLFLIHSRTLTRWVKRWCHDVGLEGNYSTHTLRKTFAYHLWDRQGRSDEALVIVSKALGHRHTGTTMDYLGIRRETIEDLQVELNL